MILYYSNMGSVKFTTEELPHKIGVLTSYFGIKKLTRPDWASTFFLDSGAFSAMRKHKALVLDDYIHFVKEYGALTDVYASLDVIGDPVTTYSNFMKMKEAGLDPLPTFHFNYDLSYLGRYFKHTNYVALGGLAKRNREERNIFLHNVFSKYPSNDTHRFHGFGINEEGLLRSYPWYSVDASSIHMQARYGGAYTPWGWMKLNPNAQAQYTKWMTPLKEDTMKKWIESIGRSYERARETTAEGIKERCLISIYMFEKVINPDAKNSYVSRVVSLLDID